jgi:hypothetical protein
MYRIQNPDVWMPVFMVWTREALIWKLRAVKVRPFGLDSNQERISMKFWKADRTIVYPDAL